MQRACLEHTLKVQSPGAVRACERLSPACAAPCRPAGEPARLARHAYSPLLQACGTGVLRQLLRRPSHCLAAVRARAMETVRGTHHTVTALSQPAPLRPCVDAPAACSYCWSTLQIFLDHTLLLLRKVLQQSLLEAYVGLGWRQKVRGGSRSACVFAQNVSLCRHQRPCLYVQLSSARPACAC